MVVHKALPGTHQLIELSAFWLREDNLSLSGKPS
jgi:hypothetical protein